MSSTHQCSATNYYSLNQHEPAVCLGSHRANHILGCVTHSTASWSKEVILLLYSVLLRPNREYCVQFWAPQHRKAAEVPESAQRRPAQLAAGLEGMCCEGRLRTLGLPSLEERRPRGDLAALRSLLRRGSAGGGAGLRSWDPMAGHGHGTELRRGVQAGHQETFLCREGDHTPQQASWGGGCCPVPVSALLVSPEVLRQFDLMVFGGPLQLNYSVLF